MASTKKYTYLSAHKDEFQRFKFVFKTDLSITILCLQMQTEKPCPYQPTIYLQDQFLLKQLENIQFHLK